jgi:hypothetical protein
MQTTTESVLLTVTTEMVSAAAVVTMQEAKELLEKEDANNVNA